MVSMARYKLSDSQCKSLLRLPYQGTAAQGLIRPFFAVMYICCLSLSLHTFEYLYSGQILQL